MRRFTLAFAAIAAAGSAHALNLEFDDLTSGAQVGSYQSFDFDDNAFVHDQASNISDYGNNYAFPSFDKGFYNAFGVQSVTVSRAADFDFIGGYFVGWGQDEQFVDFTSTSITIEGYDDGVLVGSVTRNLRSNGFRYVGANFDSVDTLVFLNDGVDAHWWIGDSLRFENVEVVPEPASMAALGLGALALLRRRRKG